jgi:hypothetical protein
MTSEEVVDHTVVVIERILDNDGGDVRGYANGDARMSSEIDDLALPAHDPNFPKPRGLLPVPPEVEEDVAREQARLQPYFTEEYAKRARDEMTLRYYYEGAYVASRRTPQGVEVLAVGWDEVKKFLEETPLEQQQGVRIGPP